MTDNIELSRPLADLLVALLPGVAEHVVAAVTDEVPAYADAFSGPMGATIQGAVELALGGFLELATRRSDLGSPRPAAVEGAYALGRGEARSGRSGESLLAAYRVGARVAWRELSSNAVEAGMPSATTAQFAELVFAYIDELSAASVAGHADELATSGRVRQRYLDLLARALVLGEPEDALVHAATRAEWAPPDELTAVVLPLSQLRPVQSFVNARSLVATEDVPGLGEDLGVLLVPGSRRALLRGVAGRPAVIGPSRPWTLAGASYRRAVRALELCGRLTRAVDSDDVLVDLVITADGEALTDLRERALAPLRGLRESTADKLEQTLRSWLLHHGRREEVAAELFVHPQTVRYRMGQLRDLYGDRLHDPQTVLQLTLALGVTARD